MQICWSRPGYDIVNVNVHYSTDLGGGPLRSLMAYAEIRNVFDETYISSANNITDRIGLDAHNARGRLGVDLFGRSAVLFRRLQDEVLMANMARSFLPGLAVAALLALRGRSECADGTRASRRAQGILR